MPSECIFARGFRADTPTAPTQTFNFAGRGLDGLATYQGGDRTHETLTIGRPVDSLRAKGALITEPRFSTPCEMRFFPREKGKTAFSNKNPQQRPFSVSRVGKIAARRG